MRFSQCSDSLGSVRCFSHYKYNMCAVSQLWELREANDSIILNVCKTDMSDRKTILKTILNINIKINRLLLIVLLSVTVYIVF